MSTLRAFHGQRRTKAKYLSRVRAHRLADEIVQGVGYDKGAGGRVRSCAVGCTLDAYSHARYEVELGIPRALAHLEDVIHEGLPREEALDWPGWFLYVIPVGADLSQVVPRFLQRLRARVVEGTGGTAAADAAEWAAADARAAAWAAAREAEWCWMRQVLLEELHAAPVSP